MNSFDLVQDFLTTYSYLAGWRELLPPPTEKSWSYLSGSRYSVETIDLAGAGYLELVATSQDTPGSVRTLDDISISHSSPDSELKLVKRPSNNTQHQLLTDTVKFAATESSRSDEPVSLPPDVVCTPPVCKVSMGKYAWADQTNRANSPLRAQKAIRPRLKTPHTQNSGKANKNTRQPTEPGREKPVTANPVDARGLEPSMLHPERAS